jgi:hypothetical protein
MKKKERESLYSEKLEEKVIKPMILENDEGDNIEIPQEHKEKVEKLLQEGCDECLNDFLNTIR